MSEILLFNNLHTQPKFLLYLAQPYHLHIEASSFATVEPWSFPTLMILRVEGELKIFYPTMFRILESLVSTLWQPTSLLWPLDSSHVRLPVDNIIHCRLRRHSTGYSSTTYFLNWSSGIWTSYSESRPCDLQVLLLTKFFEVLTVLLSQICCQVFQPTSWESQKWQISSL